MLLTHMHHLLVRSIICWCDLNKITYGLDDDEGYSITCIICWCERPIICWCDLNQGPPSHSKCLSARISERFLSSVSALKSWRQEKYNDGMKGQCHSHLVTTWSSAQEDIVGCGDGLCGRIIVALCRQRHHCFLLVRSH